MHPRNPIGPTVMGLGLLASLSMAAPPAGTVGPGVPGFVVRPGYRVMLAAENLPECRFIEVGDQGELFVSMPGAGTILELRDSDGDGTFDQRSEFVTDKKTVHGMQYFDGWLWFSTSGAIHKARDTNADGKADEVVTVLDGLVSGGGHWFRSILVTPDGFYTSIGDAGNIEDPARTDRQKIWHYTLDGGNKTLFASGLRNTEKLRLRPGTDEVWGADHGSDNYGRELGENRDHQPFTDMNPPDEFNHYIQGGFYGHPFITGNRVPRFEYVKRPDIVELGEKTIPPAWANGAHWANNGFTFLSRDYFPDHQGDALIAFHGSWNSSRPVGYCIGRILFDDVTGNPYGQLKIVDCLSKDGQVLARPVDCAEASDGTVLFSCDQPRAIYRISRE
jgi:glucose/arabinose dehydrogenase